MVFTENISGFKGLKVEAQGTSSHDRVMWAKIKPQDIQELLDIVKLAGESKTKVFRLSRVCSQEAILQKIDRRENLDFVSAIFIDMSAFNKIVEHIKDDQVISIETGMSLSALGQYLQKNNQWFPATSIFHEDCVLDFIDEASGGHQVANYGGARGLVLGLKALLSNGNLIKTGGKVVKNVTGYDLNKLFTGGQGTFGLAYQANLRLFARPLSQKLQVFAAQDMREALVLAHKLERLAQKTVGQASVQVIDARLLLAAMPNWNHLKNDFFQGVGAGVEESIFRLKATFKSGSKSQSCLVFFHTIGHAEVVSQLKKEADIFAGSISSTEFEDGSASYLSDFACQSADLLTISAGSAQLAISSSRRVLDRLMTDTLKNLDVYWYCHRPSGKLVLAHDNGEVIAWLSGIKQSGEPCVVSYKTPDSLKVVQDLSHDSESGKAMRDLLISGLKEKMDPHFMFNPFHVHVQTGHNNNG